MGNCRTNHIIPQLELPDDVNFTTPAMQINVNLVNHSGTILIKLKSGVNLANDCMSDRFSEIQVQEFKNIENTIDSILFDE